MNSIDMAQMLGRRFRVMSGCDPRSVMGEGVLVAFCQSPTIVLRADDGTLSHHSTDLPREEISEPPAESCSQCGQRTPVCHDCGDSIIFVPKSGFGQQGEWRHLAPPTVDMGPHMARPKVFVS